MKARPNGNIGALLEEYGTGLNQGVGFDGKLPDATIEEGK
jgi:hypothetical protein